MGNLTCILPTKRVCLAKLKGGRDRDVFNGAEVVEVVNGGRSYLHIKPFLSLPNQAANNKEGGDKRKVCMHYF